MRNAISILLILVCQNVSAQQSKPKLMEFPKEDHKLYISSFCGQADTPCVIINAIDTVIIGRMDVLIKLILKYKAHNDSIMLAAENILSTIRMNGYISDWKNFKKYAKEYQKIKHIDK